MRKLTTSELNRKTVNQAKCSEKAPFIIILDNIRSSHNTGSVFRTVDAFLAEAVWLCGITAKPPSRELQKTALGATESVDWKYFGNTRDAVNEARVKGYTVIAVEQAEGSVYLEDFPVAAGTGYALIFGNEVNGVDQAVLDICDGSIEIPQFGTKHSFNISVSAGIVLWELNRRLRKT